MDERVAVSSHEGSERKQKRKDSSMREENHFRYVANKAPRGICGERGVRIERENGGLKCRRRADGK